MRNINKQLDFKLFIKVRHFHKSHIGEVYREVYLNIDQIFNNIYERNKYSV